MYERTKLLECIERDRLNYFVWSGLLFEEGRPVRCRRIDCNLEMVIWLTVELQYVREKKECVLFRGVGVEEVEEEELWLPLGKCT